MTRDPGPATPGRPPAGTQVLNGRYRLERILGEGGMAVVWLGFDLALQRKVAVKVLRPQFAADPDFVRRFEEEARLAANLSHPNIVSIYDVGVDCQGEPSPAAAGEAPAQEGVRYIVMEYVEGRTLKQLLRQRGVLSITRAVHIGAQVADALDCAHRQGLVHRDVKPENVLLGPGDLVKVTDFGIARSVASASLTSPGTFMGSAPYVSPEQVQGRPASPASDVYALGALVFEALTGRPPFTGDSLEAVLVARTRQAPPPLRRLNRAVPAEVEQIVACALAIDPAQRFSSARQLADALRNYTRWEVANAPTGALPSVLPGAGTGVPGSGIGGAALGAPSPEARSRTRALPVTPPSPGAPPPPWAQASAPEAGPGLGARPPRAQARQMAPPSSSSFWLALFSLIGLGLAAFAAYLTLNSFGGSLLGGGPPLATSTTSQPTATLPVVAIGSPTPTPRAATASATPSPTPIATTSPAPSPTPTSPPEPTNTPEPTALPTPRPTFTPIPTPWPTPPPLPTPIPTATALPPLPPNMVRVPDVVGKPEAVAQAMIVQAGLSIARPNYQSYPQQPPGHVLSQMIPPGTIVPRGTILYIAVRAG